MSEFESKVYLVTGGGQGIGKGIARCLLEKKGKVVIADADVEAGRETESEYSELGEIVFVQTDVSQEDSVRESIKKSVSALGRLDGLINNAGISSPGSAPLQDCSLEDWNRVIQVNLTGAFLCAKHAVGELKKTEGSIVNIASTRAHQSEPNTFAYSASKAGIVALTHALAVSLGPAIRVNCISPGWIEVGPWRKEKLRKEAKHRVEDQAQHPVGRVGRPEDIASMVAFLLSAEAGFITGQNFVVDGGMTKKMIYAE
ncbi:MAG: SDR family oxidoreductase [Candidatus Omnitrophica bacterium]|nr:SDR family oxidoreductase [Candidatus Omnitrophota bacterium]